MEEYMEFTAKTVQDAITEACTHFIVTSASLDYVVVEEGSTGFLGIGSKPAVIKARVKEEEEIKEEPKKEEVKKEAPKAEKKEAPKTEKKEKVEKKEFNEAPKKKEPVNAEEIEKSAYDFVKSVLVKMNIENDVKVSYDAADECLNVEISGDDMGVLIGKRGQTLDSLQYLTSLVVNKDRKDYVRVKVDTENYRERRKKTLENLAKNMAFKVKRTRRPVTLEPMNPYERRIIHSALQNDNYVTTHSEGEEPYRKVVITLKK